MYSNYSLLLTHFCMWLNLLATQSKYLLTLYTQPHWVLLPVVLWNMWILLSVLYCRFFLVRLTHSKLQPNLHQMYMECLYSTVAKIVCLQSKLTCTCMIMWSLIAWMYMYSCEPVVWFPPQVNGMSVRYSTHQQAVQWLISQEGDIVLIVRHVPQPEGLQVCTYHMTYSVHVNLVSVMICMNLQFSYGVSSHFFLLLCCCSVPQSHSHITLTINTNFDLLLPAKKINWE